MTSKDAKSIIKCIHRMWYPEDGEPTFINDRGTLLNLHQHMSQLFEWAGITETRVENNPDEMTPQQFREKFMI
jgi:hypothetical protein